MSRTLYPSIRSDTGYNTMQQPGAQVSYADCLMFTLLTLGLGAQQADHRDEYVLAPTPPLPCAITNMRLVKA